MREQVTGLRARMRLQRSPDTRPHMLRINTSANARFFQASPKINLKRSSPKVAKTTHVSQVVDLSSQVLVQESSIKMTGLRRSLIAPLP